MSSSRPLAMLKPTGRGRGGDGREEDRRVQRGLSSSEQGIASGRHPGRSSQDSARGEAPEVPVPPSKKHPTPSPIFAGRKIVQKEAGGNRRSSSNQDVHLATAIQDSLIRNGSAELKGSNRTEGKMAGEDPHASVSKSPTLADMMLSLADSEGTKENVLVNGGRGARAPSDSSEMTFSEEDQGSRESTASSAAEQHDIDDELSEILGQRQKRR